MMMMMTMIMMTIDEDDDNDDDRPTMKITTPMRAVVTMLWSGQVDGGSMTIVRVRSLARLPEGSVARYATNPACPTLNDDNDETLLWLIKAPDGK